ncbi:hypothetical protein D4764_0275540%2C partial [Xyrichtys novacula]|uniref:Uncharacterized protein n=1 Tax=Xyrichtys novacula TaxID=13765 RepID=A0AAV1EIH4_XYRNO|nr:hypothetical protein D4764_0275540%2C partial [Xyrichtys novacula]
MAPLTLLPGCQSCADELKQRISTLYKIQDAEKYLDTIPHFPGPLLLPLWLQLRPMTLFRHLNNPWAHLGVKPKASAGASLFHLSAETRPAVNWHGMASCQPLNFTPHQPEPWTAVGRDRRRTARPSLPPSPSSQDIPLANSSNGKKLPRQGTTVISGPNILIILLTPAVALTSCSGTSTVSAQ